MKNKKPNAALVWKQFNDFVVPNLALNLLERAVYSHLLRHSRLEGKRRLHFSLGWLGNGVRISRGGARSAIRRLLDRGALRLVERTGAGQRVEVLLPEEIPGAFPDSCKGTQRSRSVNIEELDFFRTDALRDAIHARERGSCFYCLRASRLRCDAWIMWWRRCVPEAIRIATWCRAAWNATRGRGKRQPATTCPG